MKLFNYDRYTHVLVSILLFLLCLLFPAFYYLDSNKNLSYCHSLFLLLFGWFSLLAGYDFAWIANFLYLIGLIAYKDAGGSSILGLFASIIAFSFLFQEKIIDPFYWDLVPIVKYATGYYLWITSFLIFWLGQTWISIYRRKAN